MMICAMLSKTKTLCCLTGTLVFFNVYTSKGLRFGVLVSLWFLLAALPFQKLFSTIVSAGDRLKNKEFVRLHP